MKINVKKMLALTGMLVLVANPAVVYATEITPIEMTEEKTEEDVIEYFSSLSDEAEVALGEKKDIGLSKVKEIGKKFIAFMMDEEEIYGYHFSDLKEETKEKITSLFLKVDEKISKKYPNYLQNIKVAGKKATEFTKETYQKTKEKASNLVDTYVGEELKETVKDSLKDGVEDMKNVAIFWKDSITSWTKKK